MPVTCFGLFLLDSRRLGCSTSSVSLGPSPTTSCRYLEPDEMVPLAATLFNEDPRRLADQVWDGEDDGPTVGVILRSTRGQRLVAVGMEAC